MSRETEFWIRGRQNRDTVIEALLDSGYDVKVVLDKDSELLTGKPAYLIGIVEPEFDGLHFEAVSEMDTFIRYDEEEED